ncbi:thioesterase II family protein [Streptomyces orinoci]|uniref:Alpha/beta fold hydrolase n=1 Tax=Streptomyces orinoci TaxID=67339 RepID=A0ABV3K0Q0_STRON|nr:alpha/beta fold hydrolase [Streptomyces orinoci]
MSPPAGRREGGPRPDRWFVPLAGRPYARVTVFLFPVPGMGASFWAPLATALPETLAPVGLELPGRGLRADEQRLSSVSHLLDSLTEAFSALDHRLPAVFFGHSAGGVVAYEAARALAARDLPRPRLIGVSAIVEPRSVWSRFREMRYPSELVRTVRHEWRQTADFPRLALNAVLEDAVLLLSYRYREGPRVDCPVSLFLGAHDALVGTGGIRSWRDHTTAGVIAEHTYPGGHMYLREHWEDVARDLTADVRLALSRPPSGG